ncbi:unnamed protein product [Phyllotreta striolata]|uniref:UDP-glucuronosyltransferase n=1 Tax=Phyllotreta striolata TaxID=444603 RepID=A0A9N9XIW0_PHYSR|nr:unnamed protein product [Phyllotreta striolata]
MSTNFIFLLLLNAVGLISPAKILMVFPTPAPSHYFLGKSLAKGLVNAGHQVTMVNAIEEKNESYQTIRLNGIELALMKANLSTWQELGEQGFLSVELELNTIGRILVDYTVTHPNFQKLLRSNEKFDVVILEQFLNEGLVVLGRHFGAPVISFSTLGATIWTNDLVGNPCPFSYVPESLSGYTDRMNLWERTGNTIVSLIRLLVRHIKVIPTQKELVKEHFPQYYSQYEESLYNVSLVLVNSHESVNYPMPMVPNMVQIGGFHVKPAQKLPGDLQKFMDEAKEGVVYFSLGTNMAPSAISPEIKGAIMGALGRLKQKVMMKWDEDSVKGKPDNVMIRKFFPQQDVLAHPNIKLFVTHGGLLSAFETVYNSVPVLALPIFADQRLNAAKIQNDGYGLFISFTDITEQNFYEAMRKLLDDRKYRDNVNIRSTLMRDVPIKPLDLAVYWVEYVIKHKGAPHLRIAGLDLAWYQYYLLDVIFLITFVFSLVLLFIYYALKFLLKFFVKNNKHKTA